MAEPALMDAILPARSYFANLDGDYPPAHRYCRCALIPLVSRLGWQATTP
jgi:hypothetical protein